MNRLFGSETSFPLFFLGGRQAKLMKCFSWALSFPTNVDKLDLPMGKTIKYLVLTLIFEISL